MATVFALIFLPALAAVALMGLTTVGSLDVRSAIMIVSFTILTSGMFLGLYRMMQRWEDEPVD